MWTDDFKREKKGGRAKAQRRKEIKGYRTKAKRCKEKSLCGLAALREEKNSTRKTKKE
jgi:hypothetical protein